MSDKKGFIFNALLILGKRLEGISDEHFREDGLTIKDYLFTVYLEQKVKGIYEPDINELVKEMNVSHKEINEIAVKLEGMGLIKIENQWGGLHELQYSLTDRYYDFWTNRSDKDEILISLLLAVLSDKETNSLFKIIKKLYTHIFMLFSDRSHIFKDLNIKLD